MKSRVHEKEMLSAIKKGDKNAYSLLYTKYYNRLCKYIYSLSGDYKQAEDLVQDILIDIWLKRDKLKINTSLNNYLYRSSYNRFINQHKKNARKKMLTDLLHIEAIIELEDLDNDIKEFRLVALENAINRLPPKRRAIFILSKFNDYKHKEIANMRNISLKTVETHMRKAMISIREEMMKLRLEGIISFLIILI